jgi:hypothetical protein
MGTMNVWQVFWVLFVLVPLTIAWAFAVFDIFRRDDLSGWGKAAWFAAVILLPWLGTFVYLLFRPREIPREIERAEAAAREAYQKSLAADQIAKLSALHTQGELTDQEFASAKAHLLLTIGVHTTQGVAAPTAQGMAAPTH